MPMLRSLQPVSLELKKFSNKYPQLFFKVTKCSFNLTVFKLGNNEVRIELPVALVNVLVPLPVSL